MALLLEHARKNGWWAEHRISPKNPPDELVREAVRDKAKSDVMGGPLAYLFFRYVMPVEASVAALPTPSELGWQLLLSLLWAESTFYFGHRLMHENKWLYRTVHRQHHKFYAAIGIAAQYR